MPLRRPDYWNAWWTLTVISAALTIVALVLEMLGVFHDVGLLLSALGLLLTLVFGFTASTRSSWTKLGGMSERLDGTNDRLDRVIALLDERLPRSTA